MKQKIIFYIGAVLLFFFTLHTYEVIPAEELPDSIHCGIYNQDVKPFAVGEFGSKGGTMFSLQKGLKIWVKVKRVYTKMCRDKGEFPRYMVHVSFNDVEALSLSHTDIPFAINIFHDKVKYRVICVDR